MALWIMILKSLVKSSVDNYLLPGTMTGTEILWLYMVQWKRNMSALTFAAIYFVCSQFDLIQGEKVISSTQSNHSETVE